MNGVTIIETITEPASIVSNILWWIALIGTLIFAFSTFYSLAQNWKNELFPKREKIGGIILLLLLLCCGFWFIPSLIKEGNIPVTTYRVSVDDSVSFNEFMDYYQIVGKSGDTYIVKNITTED